MLLDQRILAVVPARSGSKGIPHKNLRELDGVSLIGRAARCLAELSWIDAAVISTDSPRYAAEARRHGLAAPFLRPAELAGDESPAVDTLVHALHASEAHFGVCFDVVLIIEPTSPLRTAADVALATRRLIESRADSAVTVSRVPSRFHPQKLLTCDRERLTHYAADGSAITARQQLAPGVFWRNGLCYALTRACLVEHRAVITERSIAVLIDRPVANIDDPLDLLWARFLREHAAAAAPDDDGLARTGCAVERPC
ncbi:MAG: hypothetical protein AB7Q17_04095 [Phycisphaerae bacterium]